jgi:hypothetical protein
VQIHNFRCSIPRSHLFTQLGNDQYPPHSAQNQASPGVSNFLNGFGPIFSMYLEMATEDDTKMVENWKWDADEFIIFVRFYCLIRSFVLTQWP